MQNEENQAVDLENNVDTVEQTATETVEDTTDYKAEALKWKAIAERNKKKPNISESVTKQSEVKPSDILKADEFKLYRQGYTESEIDLIMHNGGAKILEDKTNPLVLGLQAAKEQRGAEDAANRVTDSSGLSEIERKYTEQDLRNMSSKDLEKLLPHTNK
jgi:hypothetical protein